MFQLPHQLINTQVTKQQVVSHQQLKPTHLTVTAIKLHIFQILHQLEEVCFPENPTNNKKKKLSKRNNKLPLEGYISLVSTHTCTVAPLALTPRYIFQSGSHSTPTGILLIPTSGLKYKCVCVCGVIKGSGEKVRPECVCMFISTGPVIFSSRRQQGSSYYCG